MATRMYCDASHRKFYVHWAIKVNNTGALKSYINVCLKENVKKYKDRENPEDDDDIKKVIFENFDAVECQGTMSACDNHLGATFVSNILCNF